MTLDQDPSTVPVSKKTDKAWHRGRVVIRFVIIGNASAKNEGEMQVQEAFQYNGEEDDIVCGRFPHMDVCACDI